MIIFNNKYRIRKHDNYNITVESYNKVIRKTTKEEDYEWQIEGYYTTVKQALVGVERLAQMDAIDLADNYQDFVNYLETYKVGVKIEDENYED